MALATYLCDIALAAVAQHWLPGAADRCCPCACLQHWLSGGVALAVCRSIAFRAPLAALAAVLAALAAVYPPCTPVVLLAARRVAYLSKAALQDRLLLHRRSRHVSRHDVLQACLPQVAL